MGVSGRLPSFSGPPVFVCVRLAGPAVEAFWLRDVSWNHASSPRMNPAGVYVLRITHKRLARSCLLRSAAARLAPGTSFLGGRGAVLVVGRIGPGRLGGPVQGSGDPAD